MYNYIFGCNNVSINIETNNKKLLSDLYSLYGEYYCDKSKPILTIRFIEGPITKDIIDNYQIADSEEENDTNNYINYKDNILSVYFDNYNFNKLQFMQRIMINTFIMELQRNGYVIIHGSCVTKDGKCYIISGNKGSGKTTTLLKLLELGYDFISNDKVAIKKHNGKIIACGIPHAMGIITSDIKKYNINPEYGRIDGSKIYFKVADISKTFNVEVHNKAVLNGIIFPKYGPGIQNIDVSSCKDNQKQLGKDNIFKEEAVSQQKRYLLDIMEPIDYSDASIINEINGYHVIQGEYTFDQLKNFMNDSKLNKRIVMDKKYVYNNYSNI